MVNTRSMETIVKINKNNEMEVFYTCKFVVQIKYQNYYFEYCNNNITAMWDSKMNLLLDTSPFTGTKTNIFQLKDSETISELNFYNYKNFFSCIDYDDLISDFLNTLCYFRDCENQERIDEFTSHIGYLKADLKKFTENVKQRKRIQTLLDNL